MKATIEFDDLLYRRLKVEAARQGRTVRELVADGVRYVLDGPPAATAVPETTENGEWRPAWLGQLRKFAASVEDHSIEAARASIVHGRSRATGE